MELIRDVIDFIATGLGGLLATLAPYGFIGLVGLYLLWVVIGYLRVSQVGAQAEATTLPALQLPRAPDGAIDVPRGARTAPTTASATRAAPASAPSARPTCSCPARTAVQRFEPPISPATDAGRTTPWRPHRTERRRLTPRPAGRWHGPPTA